MAGWPPASLRTRLTDLQETRRALRELPTGVHDFTEVCLARYLGVRSTGYLEAVRDDVGDQHVASKASDEVARRVRAHLRTGQGVAPSQMLDFVKSFHPGWHTELDQPLADNDQILKSNLGALVAARKKIAHGDGESVTVGKALGWSETAELLGGWLIRRFDPDIPVIKPVSRMVTTPDGDRA